MPFGLHYPCPIPQSLDVSTLDMLFLACANYSGFRYMIQFLCGFLTWYIQDRSSMLISAPFIHAKKKSLEFHYQCTMLIRDLVNCRYIERQGDREGVNAGPRSTRLFHFQHGCLRPPLEGYLDNACAWQHPTVDVPRLSRSTTNS
jgi:hypothetical protein